MTDGHLFNNISLGGRVGNNPGQFKLYSGGLAWKKHGGENPIEVDKAHITSVTWMKIPRSYQLSVGTKEGLFYRFFGLCEQGAQTVGMGAQKLRVFQQLPNYLIRQMIYLAMTCWICAPMDQKKSLTQQ